MLSLTTDERSVSPVIGVVLFVGIVIALAAVASFVFLGLTETNDPSPDVVLSLEPTEDGVTYKLEHGGGDQIVGDRTEFVGVANESILHNGRLGATETVEVIPTQDEVQLLWHDDGDTGYILQTFEVDAVPYAPDHDCEWVEDEIEDNDDLDLHDGEVVNCNVRGDTDTSKDDVDIDMESGAVILGDVDTDGDVNLDDAIVTGDVRSDADDITLTNGSTIKGTVQPASDTNVDIDGGTEVEGGITVPEGDLDVDDAVIEGTVRIDEGTMDIQNTVIEGPLVSNGPDPDLDNVTITGHVYADDLDCSDSALGPDDEDCDDYDLRDPDDF